LGSLQTNNIILYSVPSSVVVNLLAFDKTELFYFRTIYV